MVFANGTGETPSSQKEQEGTTSYKIGAITLTSGHTFWNIIEENLKKKADALGVEMIVRDGQNDSNVQYSEAQNLITQGVDAIILSPADTGTSGTCDVAREAGIPVFYLNILGQGDYQGNVLTNEIQGGENAGKWAVQYAEKYLNGKAKCAIITYDEISCCVDRAEGFKNELKNHDGMKVLAEQTYSGDTEKAAAVTQDFLTQFPDLDIIFAVGDPAAQGALEVIKAEGSHAIVIGYDGNPEAATAIMNDVDGKVWKADVVQDSAKEAQEIVQLVVDYLNGKTITKENLVDTYVMDKAYLQSKGN
jgi:ribose transport system substrate-binding protein